LSLCIFYKDGTKIDLYIFVVVFFIQNLLVFLSNLVNTYYDFINQVDKAETSADRTLFDYQITLKDVHTFIYFTLALIVLNLSLLYPTMDPFIFYTKMVPLVLFSIIISYSYTAPPLVFKYKAMGEVSIILGISCLLPLNFLAQNHYISWKSIHFSMIYSLGVELILHANNHRDLEKDKQSGITTLAILMGPTLSYLFYFSIYAIMFLYCYCLSIFYDNVYLNIPLISIPDIFIIYYQTRNKNFYRFDQKSSKMLLEIVLLLSIGVLSG